MPRVPGWRQIHEGVSTTTDRVRAAASDMADAMSLALTPPPSPLSAMLQHAQQMAEANLLHRQHDRMIDQMRADNLSTTRRAGLPNRTHDERVRVTMTRSVMNPDQIECCASLNRPIEVGQIIDRSEFMFREMTATEVTMRMAEYANVMADRIADTIRADIAASVLAAYERMMAPNQEELRDRYLHGLDLAAGAVNFIRNKIDFNDDLIESVIHLPALITHGPFKAELLNTTNKCAEEGDKMKHCFKNSYTQRIVAGNYAAYHISGMPKGPKSGFTLGFRHQPQSQTHKWLHDQLKGQKNDTYYCQNLELREFTSFVERTINEASAAS